jgi:hypothetical protein
MPSEHLFPLASEDSSDIEGDLDEELEVGEGDLLTPLTDSDWIKILHPLDANRDGEERFFVRHFLREFILHCLHPVCTPFVWGFIRATSGKQRARLFVTSHVWQLQLREKTITANIMTFIQYLFLNVFFPVAPFALIALVCFNVGASQNYTTEAIFLLVLKCAWSLVVGVKYGFYSEKLHQALRIRPIPANFILAEQILNNWAPPLDRLMFELRVCARSGPVYAAASPLSISKNHPVAIYCQMCNSVKDTPMCLLEPTQISNLLQALPAKNFHKEFWTRPAPVIESKSVQNSEYFSRLDVASYRPFLGSQSLSSLLDNAERGYPEVPLSNSASHYAVEGNSDYVSVPAGVMAAYCVSRSWTFGRDWTGSGPFDYSCKIFKVIFGLNAIHCVVPSIFRFAEVMFLIFSLCHLSLDNDPYSHVFAPSWAAVPTAKIQTVQGFSLYMSDGMELTLHATLSGRLVPFFGLPS